MPYPLIAHLLVVFCSVFSAALQVHQSAGDGDAQLWLAPKGGDRSHSKTYHRETNALQQAATTNQWFSDPISNQNAEPLGLKPSIKPASTKRTNHNFYNPAA